MDYVTTDIHIQKNTFKELLYYVYDSASIRLFGCIFLLCGCVCDPLLHLESANDVVVDELSDYKISDVYGLCIQDDRIDTKRS